MMIIMIVINFKLVIITMIIMIVSIMIKYIQTVTGDIVMLQVLNLSHHFYLIWQLHLSKVVIIVKN